jgi:hypothetical protein
MQTAPGAATPQPSQGAASSPAPASQQAEAPHPDSKTRKEPPAQGQVDARKAEQKRDFDTKR